MIIYELVKTQFNDKGNAIKEIGHIKLNDYDLGQVIEAMKIVESEANSYDYTHHITDGLINLRRK